MCGGLMVASPLCNSSLYILYINIYIYKQIYQNTCVVVAGVFASQFKIHHLTYSLIIHSYSSKNTLGWVGVSNR